MKIFNTIRRCLIWAIYWITIGEKKLDLYQMSKNKGCACTSRRMNSFGTMIYTYDLRKPINKKPFTWREYRKLHNF